MLPRTAPTRTASNVANALSFTQTQDGYLQGIGNALTQMSQLSVEAQDQTKSDADREEYQQEFQQLAQYIQSTATKDFGGVSLFSGNNISVTLDADNSEALTMTPINMASATYATATSSDISTTLGAISAMAAINGAIQQLSEDRATLGSWETRLNYASNQLSVTKENLTAASSQITDVNVANESTTYATQNVLLQSGTAMLAQANQLPQTVLKLIS